MATVPGGFPKASAIATRAAGAICNTKIFPSTIALSIEDFELIVFKAPVGQTVKHCPQLMHSLSLTRGFK